MRALAIAASSSLMAVAFAGCASTPAASPSRLAETEEASGLVWFVDGHGRHRTLWVSRTEGKPLSSLPIDGPLWAAGSMLWQWTEEPVEVPLVECGTTPASDPALGGALGSAERGAADVIGTATAHRVILRELTHSLALEVRGAPSLEPVRALSHGVEPVASVGPYVFVVERLSYASCSARPSAEARTLVWDLTAARPAEVLSDDEREAVATTARARLSEQGLEAAEPLELAALTPRWDPARGLSLDYLFVAERGEGPSSAPSAHVRASSLPDTLAERGRVPRWVRAALARVEGATLRGFSRLDHPAPLRVLDSLRR
jgi:hypothetical protein